MLWIPILINSLLIYGVYLNFDILNVTWQNYSTGNMVEELIPVWQIVVRWLAVSVLMTGLFFVFTSFVGMFTGNTLLQGALSLIGLFLPLGIYILVKVNLARMLYGFSENVSGGKIAWLSPIVSYLDQQGQGFTIYWTGYITYLVFTLLFVILSVLLYRLRRVEAAGDTLAADWIRWVFKYGVAICAALSGGIYLGSVMRDSMEALYFGYFIGAALGYIIADVIAHKSFQFYKRWKQIITFGLVFTLLVFVVKFDVVGYETYVPKQEQIKEVSFGNYFLQGQLNNGLASEENKARVTELHKAIVANKDKNLHQINNQQSRYSGTLIGIELNYTLKDGDKVKRTYSINVLDYEDLLGPILDSAEAREMINEKLLEVESQKLEQITINNYRQGKNISIRNPEEVEMVVSALKKDAMEAPYRVMLDRVYFSGPQIEFYVRKTKNHSDILYSMSYHPEFKELKGFLTEKGYFEKLFIDASLVKEIYLGQAGQEKEVKITDPKIMQEIITLGYKEDAESFKMRLDKGAATKQYFARVIMKSGETLYLGFDYDYYTQAKLKDLL